MAYSSELAERIRRALAGMPHVEEKKMFGSLAFMVNEKLCLTAGKDRMMCRIDPDMHENAIEKNGCRTVIMKGKAYKGYVYVSEESIQAKADFDYWVALALDFNRKTVSLK